QGTYAWPAYLSVAPNGDVFVAYHFEPGYNQSFGGVVVVRYDQNLANPQQSSPFPIGLTLPDGTVIPGTAVRRLSYPNEPFPPDSSGNGGSQGAAGPWVLADPARPGNVYVVSINDPNPGSNTLDPADLVFARSTDYGAHWTTSTLEAGPGNSLQVF